MGECDKLVPGIGLALIGLFLLYGVTRERGKASLSARLPVCPCGRPQEGMIQLAGKAVGSASITSALLGLPCLAFIAKVEAYDKHAKKRKWRKICDEKQSVPFNIEDGSGSMWVDVTDADLYLSPDVEYSTATWRWKPKPGQMQQIGDTVLTTEVMEQRVRAMYERSVRGHYNLDGDPSPEFTEQERQKEAKRREKATRQLADVVRKKKLRATEKILLAGDAVCIVGPAYQDPSSGVIRLHKVHPSDRFFLGDGTPEELRARIHKEARWWHIGGIIMLVGGAALAASCSFGA